MTSSGGGLLEFHNIQEIVNIELMFELICMSFILITNDQKRGNNNKTGESTKLLLYYIVVKCM